MLIKYIYENKRLGRDEDEIMEKINILQKELNVLTREINRINSQMEKIKGIKTEQVAHI